VAEAPNFIAPHCFYFVARNEFLLWRRPANGLDQLRAMRWTIVRALRGMWRLDPVRRAFWNLEPGLRAAYCDFFSVRDGRWESAWKFDAAAPGYWDGMRSLGPDAGVFDGPMVDRLIGYQPFFPSCAMVERTWFLSVGGWDEGGAGSRAGISPRRCALPMRRRSPCCASRWSVSGGMWETSPATCWP
jgi:hypothetical protein